MRNLILLLLVLFGASTVQAQTPVIDLPYWKTPKEWYGRPGWEERGPEFRKWLAPSVRVTKRGGGGSGTICYYDPDKNEAYVVSCGHLFQRGKKSAEDYKQSPDTRKVEVFYHNNKKLDEPDVYTAQVLCHVWLDHVYDVSLMKFKPRWKDPWIAPIAPKDYKLIKGKTYHSTGCDGLTETAHYVVTYLEERSRAGVTEIITSTKNGPRGGRSGGGVLTDDGELVFICSRGSGSAAYWTSLHQIHKFLNEQGFDYVLEGYPLARQIPVVDRNGSQGKYARNYIPLPRFDD